MASNMRKHDPRYEITPSQHGALMGAVLLTESGRKLWNFLPTTGEAERLRKKNIQNWFNDVDPNAPGPDELANLALEDLINEMARLLPVFYDALDRGDPDKLKYVLDEGFPVNIENPINGETALHALAAGGARPVLRFLIRYMDHDLNYLVRDNHGRLPSELAYLYGDDLALARLLGNKERKQAQKRGTKLTRRPAS